MRAPQHLSERSFTQDCTEFIFVLDLVNILELLIVIHAQGPPDLHGTLRLQMIRRELHLLVSFSRLLVRRALLMLSLGQRESCRRPRSACVSRRQVHLLVLPVIVLLPPLYAHWERQVCLRLIVDFVLVNQSKL